MKKIIICFVLSFLVFSCQEDFLETIPDDRISTAIFWKTENDVLLAANALYPTLDGPEDIIGYDGITDILLTNRAFDARSVIQAGNADNSLNIFFNEWSQAYSGIRRAIDFFASVDKVETDNTALINQLKGEVRTIRANHYIKLVMLYGDVPLITEGLSVETALDVRRTPKSEVWDYINSELTIAASELPTSISTDGRVTRGAALALKARAMLFAGRYTEASSAAQQVMALGDYSLSNSYEDLFQYEGESSSEIIFTRQYAPIPDNSTNYYSLFAPASVAPSSNGSFYVPTKAIVDIYDMQATGLPITNPLSGFDSMNPYSGRDPRLRASLFVSDDPLPNGRIFNSTPGTLDITDPPGGGGDVQTGVTGFNVRKYVSFDDFENQGNSGINLILLRYAEVLLTYAESKIEMNDIDQSVLDAINEVRGRTSVNMPAIPMGLNQMEMREIVRKERTIELAFEGTRLFDIRRWLIAENVMPGSVLGLTYIDTGGNEITVDPGVNLSFNPSRDYLWPIPARQRDFNPNLAQNPGW